MTTIQELFGEPIHVYTREQAVDDGVLVDFTDPEQDPAVRQVAHQHFRGKKVLVTRAVFEIMNKAVQHPHWCNDFAGVLHDMLWMSKAFCRHIGPSARMFRVKITGAGRRQLYDFKRVDDEDAVTIMLTTED